MMDKQSDTYAKKKGYFLWSILVIGLIAVMLASAVIMLLGNRIKVPEPAVYVPGEKARSMIADLKAKGTQPDLDKLFNYSENLITKGELEDAHLLLFYAARLGHIQSARVLGGMYDPNYYSADTSIMDKPDPAQAYKWYKKAAEGGDKKADQQLADLRILVEQDARRGQEESKLLLQRW